MIRLVWYLYTYAVGVRMIFFWVLWCSSDWSVKPSMIYWSSYLPKLLSVIPNSFGHCSLTRNSEHKYIISFFLRADNVTRSCSNTLQSGPSLEKNLYTNAQAATGFWAQVVTSPAKHQKAGFGWCYSLRAPSCSERISHLHVFIHGDSIFASLYLWK